MSTVKTTITVVRGDAELEIVVIGYYTPASPARTYGPAEDCYPGEGGEIDDFEATFNGTLFELTAEEEDLAYAALEEKASSDPDDADLDYDSEVEYDRDYREYDCQ